MIIFNVYQQSYDFSTFYPLPRFFFFSFSFSSISFFPFFLSFFKLPIFPFYTFSIKLFLLRIQFFLCFFTFFHNSTLLNHPSSHPLSFLHPFTFCFISHLSILHFFPNFPFFLPSIIHVSFHLPSPR